MEVILYSFAALFGIIAFFLSIERPYILAPIIIFMYLYPFNVETPLPLDLRGILTILLFVRIVIFDKENLAVIKNEMTSSYFTWFIIIFFLLGIGHSIIGGGNLLLEIRNLILTFVSLSVGYLMIRDKVGILYLSVPIIIIGLLSSLDVIYSLTILGQFDIHRPLDIILGRQLVDRNHNFPGMLAGIGLIFSVIFFLKYPAKRLIIILLIIIQSAGLLISTSRSSLLAVMLTLLIIAVVQPEIKLNIKKILTSILILAGLLTSFYFGFNALATNKNVDDSFLAKIHKRLFEEPARIFGEEEDKEYDKYSGDIVQGTMSWRYGRALRDFAEYQKLPFTDQIFGLGPGKYTEIAETIYRHNNTFQYAAHNGYIVLLVERGLVGVAIFLFILIGTSYKSLRLIKKYNMEQPLVYVVVALAIYAIGQNSEFISPINFLFFGGMIAYINRYSKNSEELEVSDEEEVQEHHQEAQVV